MIFKTVNKYKSWLCICICICIISGCIFPLPVYVDNDAKDTGELLVVGKTTKDEVRDLLGNPDVVLDDPNLEVYYVDGSLGYFMMFFIYPYWYGTDDMTSHVIVEYKNNIVNDFDFGFNKLKIKNVSFDYDTKTFLAPKEYIGVIKDETEKTRHENRNVDCKIYVAPTKVGSIFLDELRLGHGADSNGFFYQELAPGEHQLEVCDVSRIIEVEAKNLFCLEPLTFQCNEGEDVYFHVYTSNRFTSYLKKEQAPLKIEQSRSVPSWVNSRELIIGQDYVPVNY